MTTKLTPAQAVVASQAEAEAGIATNGFMTPLATSQAIASQGTLITDRFVSAELDIAYGSAAPATIAHGFGAVPFEAFVHFICKTAEFGYSVGDVILFHTSYDSSTTGRSWLPSVVADATNLYISNPRTGIVAPNKTTGGLEVLVAANWKYLLKARK
tara:strand:+ start:7810 stop:8280 length:471 start_codon:yes stop_codon:yes gene_type:complete